MYSCVQAIPSQTSERNTKSWCGTRPFFNVSLLLIIYYDSSISSKNIGLLVMRLRCTSLWSVKCGSMSFLVNFFFVSQPTDSAVGLYDAKIKLSRQSMTEIQTLLEGEESWRTGALDNAISQILVDLKPHDYQAWKWRFEDTFSIELDTALKVMLSSNPNVSGFRSKCAFSQWNVPRVYIPVGPGSPAHRGHHKYAAVVAGRMVYAAKQAVCCVLCSQYNLELVLHVQGKEQTMVFFVVVPSWLTGL